MTTLKSPSGLLQAIFNGLHFKAGLHCTKIIDRVENKFTSCVFVCFFLADRVVQEQCCVAVLEDNMCNTGINMAKDQGACDSLFTSTCETKTTKVCFVCVLVHIHIHRARPIYPLAAIAIQYRPIADISVSGYMFSDMGQY